MPYRIDRYGQFVSTRVDEGLREWIIAAAIAAAPSRAAGQEATKPEVVRQTVKKRVDTTITIDFATAFESGRYRLSRDTADEVKAKLARVAEFVDRHRQQNIVIRIEGSESRVPNFDAETGKALPEMGLAVRRVEETRSLIQGLLEEMGRSEISVDFDTKVRVGGPAFQRGDDPREQRYTDHQYVTVTLSAKGAREAQAELRACGYRREFSAGIGVPDKDFAVSDSTLDIDLGTGTGRIAFKFDPALVPDIFIVEYNGKVYMTGLLGSETPYHRLAYGTIIGNYYRTRPKPAWFKSLMCSPVDKRTAVSIAEADVTADVSDFAHVFGAGERVRPVRGEGGRRRRRADFERLFSDTTITPIMLDRGQIQDYDNTSPSWAESNWGIIIDKVEGADKARVIPVGVIGQTRWKLHIECMDCK